MARLPTDDEFLEGWYRYVVGLPCPIDERSLGWKILRELHPGPFHEDKIKLAQRALLTEFNYAI